MENNQGEMSFYDSVGELIKQDESSLNQDPNVNPEEKDKGEDPQLNLEDVQKQLDQMTANADQNANKPAEQPADNAKPDEDLWFLDPSEEPKDNSGSEDWKAKYEELESKFKSIESDDLINLHLKYKTTEGYSFDKLVESFAKPKGDNLTLEEMYTKYLENAGASEDDVYRELSLLESKTMLEKKDLESRLKELVKPTTEGGNEYLDVLERQRTTQEKARAEEMAKLERAWNGANQFMENLSGKQIGSFEITKDVVTDLRESFNNPDYYKSEDGNYNHQKQVMERFWGMYGPQIAKALVEKAKADFIDSRSRPTAPGAGKTTVGAPPVDTRGKQDKDVSDYFNKTNISYTK